MLIGSLLKGVNPNPEYIANLSALVDRYWPKSLESVKMSGTSVSCSGDIMMLTQILYVSQEIHKFTDDDLVELLKKSRPRNTKLGITGILLYKSGKFLHILEGETKVVERVVNRIKKDPRHNVLGILSKTTVEQREFGDWSMAFSNLNKLDLKNIAGYSEAFLLTRYLPEDLDFEVFSEDVQGAHSLLNIFKTSPHLLDS